MFTAMLIRYALKTPDPHSLALMVVTIPVDLAIVVGLLIWFF